MLSFLVKTGPVTLEHHAGVELLELLQLQMDRMIQLCEDRQALSEDNRMHNQMKHVDQVRRDKTRRKRGAAESSNRLAIFRLQALNIGDQVLSTDERMQPALQHSR